MDFKLRSIGTVKSPVSEPVDEKWGKVKSKIIIDQEFSKGLIGLEQFSHAIIVFYMHISKFDPVNDLVRRPQGREDMPLVGIFSQRAKHRPNPIGLTSVKVLEVKGNVVTVEGLDAIDGTPVLDIKPYVPKFDNRNDAIVTEWIDRLMKNYF